MSGAPWWVTLAADMRAAQSSQRGRDRSEWFRRVQWAQTLLEQEATQIVGLGLLRALSADADDGDATLISVLLDASPAIAKSIALGNSAKTTDVSEFDRTVDNAVGRSDTDVRGTEGTTDV